MNAKIGEWAFLVSIVIAVLAGLASATGAIAAWSGGITALLVILGIIVGFLNISEKETTAFLVAAIALVAAGTASFSAIGAVGSVIDSILGFIGNFVAPAAVIVALKAVYALGKSK